MSLYSSFFAAISPHLTKRSRLILAFSGGVDSRVLLHLLAQFKAEHANTEALIVHVHHGLSENADEWAERCQQWAQEYAMPCHVERVNCQVEGSASLEQVARNARYTALEKYVGRDDIILTGQHSDDQVETFLLALKRGSGPKGLSSMAQVKHFAQGLLVRPLLTVCRDQIEAYAHQHNLNWVTDESNADIRFDRNYLRHQVTPVLKQRWHDFNHSVARSALLCAEQEALLDELLAPMYEQAIQADLSLSITELSDKSEAIRNRLLRMWLDKQQQSMPSKDQLQTIWQQVAQAKADANPQFILNSIQIRRFQQRLYLVTPYADLSDISQPITIESVMTLPDAMGELSITKNMATQLLHAEKGILGLNERILNKPLTVQFYHNGLTVHPYVRAHRRKLKKVLQEYGVPSWQRQRLPLVFCGEHLVAIAYLFVEKDFYGHDFALKWQR